MNAVQNKKVQKNCSQNDLSKEFLTLFKFPFHVYFEALIPSENYRRQLLFLWAS